MATLPQYLTGEYTDQDTDSVFQARVELHAGLGTVNQIVLYLSELFGSTGTKSEAIATLFSNQAVLFPAGTRMYFMQAAPPPGWVQMPLDVGRYLMAVPDNSGGNPVGNSFVTLQSSSTALVQGHLPSVWFTGTADYQGEHAHSYQYTTVNYSSGQVSFERDANGPRAYALYSPANTSGAGNHSHNISVHSGGGGWGHDHWVNMSSYQPHGLRGVIGIKV